MKEVIATPYINLKINKEPGVHVVLDETKKDGVYFIKLTVKSIKKRILPEMELKWSVPLLDIQLYKSLQTSKGGVSVSSVHCFMDKNGSNRYTIACSDILQPIQCAPNWKEMCLDVEMTLFSESTWSLHGYETELRIDTRMVETEELFKDLAKWYERKEINLASTFDHERAIDERGNVSLDI
jgi:hypothetical protein